MVKADRGGGGGGRFNHSGSNWKISMKSSRKLIILLQSGTPTLIKVIFLKLAK